MTFLIKFNHLNSKLTESTSGEAKNSCITSLSPITRTAHTEKKTHRKILLTS